MTAATAAPLLIAAGLVCLFAATIVFINQRRIFEVVPNSNVVVEIPERWDDAEITRLLQRHLDQPAVLSHIVSSIKTRMILGQNFKTAQQRLKLVASVIEVFKLGRELQGVLHDIHLAETDFEIRTVEGRIGLEDANARLASERELRGLRRKRDEFVLKKEIADLEQGIKTATNPLEPEPKLSPEQERANRHVRSEARLTKLKEEKQKALKIEDEQERIPKVNALDDEIQREIVEWSKTLP